MVEVVAQQQAKRRLEKKSWIVSEHFFVVLPEERMT